MVAVLAVGICDDDEDRARRTAETVRMEGRSNGGSVGAGLSPQFLPIIPPHVYLGRWKC